MSDMHVSKYRKKYIICVYYVHSFAVHVVSVVQTEAYD